MGFNLNKLLATIEAASRVYNTAVSVAEDAALTLGTADQGTLRVRLIELREQNEEGFDRLQRKLALLIKEGNQNG